MANVLVRDAVPLFLEGIETMVSPNTLAFYRHYLTRFVEDAGDVPLKDVSPVVVHRFSTKYHPVVAVQRLCSWARLEAHLIKRNPLQGMKNPRHGHRRRILSDLERVRLLRACRPSFRAFVLAMLESIGRPGEIREVKWGNIRTSGKPTFSVDNLVDGQAFFWLDKFKAQNKRGDRYAIRLIPISARLGRLLARMWGDGRQLGDVIFQNRDKRGWTSNAVRCQFRRVRLRAALGADVRGERVVAYSMRHTAATAAAGAGLKAFTLAELMGHSDIRMTQRYVHFRPDHLIEATKAISKWKRDESAKKRPPRIA